MNHLSKIIDNKQNDFNVIYIEKFNVKKFCKNNGYHYSNIPKMFDYNVSDIHYHIRVEGIMLSDEPIIIHLDYSENMKNAIKSLLSDSGIDKGIYVIITNNNARKVSDDVLKNVKFRYNAKDTGFKLKDWL